jgi:hypothetical protein
MKRNLILTFLGASVILITGALAFTGNPSASPSASPGGHGGHGHGGGLLGHLSYALGLSGTQQGEIAPILEAAKPQFQAIEEQAKKERDLVISSIGIQVTPLLTGTQQARLAEIMQHMESGPGPGWGGGRGGGRFGRFGGRGGGGPGMQGGQLQHLTAALGLSSDQQGQIKQILDATRAQAQTIFGNTSLTQDQKFAQAQQAREATNGQINSVLTPAQQTAFAAMKDRFHHRWNGGQPGASPSASPATE